MKFPHGLVIGKFYPPHRGHQHLIESALAGSKRVTVLVCVTRGETIPAATRAAWIRELYPHADVRVVDSDVPDDDSPGWAAETIRWLGAPPDAVFTSEDYGDPYAAALGSTHVSVDRDRGTFPVSGTAVRRDPYAQWEFLSPPVRAWYAKRVVIVGAESTGTTTLARALAERLDTIWVPEYGRLYSEGKYATDPVWRGDEFMHIARMQAEMEDTLARSAQRVLICDTDPFATGLWHERYLGCRSSEVETFAGTRVPDLYLLTGDEIPFVQDGTRDGEAIRHAMHRRFEEELEKCGLPHLIVRGSHEERMVQALEAIRALFAASQ